MKEVTLNSYSAFTIPFAGIHKNSGRIVRSDGYILAKQGGKLWTNGSKHKAKGSSITYMRVSAGHKKYMLHVLVAETFLKNPENKPTVDHIDRDTSNNDVFNLRYADYTEQARNTKSYLSAPPISVRKARIKQQHRQYYLDHIDTLKKKQRQYYVANADKVKKYSREYYYRRRHSS